MSLPSHVNPDGSPRVSASAAGGYLSCPGSWALVQLAPPRIQESKRLSSGTDIHAVVFWRITDWLTGEAGPAPEVDTDTQDAADAIHWRLRSIIGPIAPTQYLAEERLVSGNFTAAPDFAFISELEWVDEETGERGSVKRMTVTDAKRSGRDITLPPAGESPQLLVQAGLLLTLWEPAKNVDEVVLGYVMPDHEDISQPISAFEIAADFAELQRKFEEVPKLEFNLGSWCDRCSQSHHCPKVGKEPIFREAKDLSHEEVAEMYVSAKARGDAADAVKQIAGAEIMERLEGGLAPDEIGYKVRRDRMHFMPDGVQFLTRNGIALESAIKQISLSQATALLSELYDRPLTDEEAANLKACSSEKQKAPFLQALRRKSK